jgi:L-lactate dehydrogenase complex protein LldF
MRVQEALNNAQLQAALQKAAGKFDAARRQAWAELDDVDTLRRRAKAIKNHTLENLDHYLTQLSAQVTAAGGTVHIATTAADARQIIIGLIQAAGASLAVKSKSMTSEEIGLNEALLAANITPVETDLGEWILQLAGETPSHIVAPAIHKSRAEVADLFARFTGQPLANADIPTLTAVARTELRRQFLLAGVGISGVNFAVAETGTLALVTNEGNGRFVTSIPPLHIALMGLEKVIPSLDDLALMLELLPRSATGQTLTSYVQLVTGPRREGESDGPYGLHLVILDGGRRAILESEFSESLQCLRCGACLNICPVYRVIGGHAYGSVYSGPIGAVQTPLLSDMPEAAQLPQASTLCGACRDVCPVMIDIPRMLLAHRRRNNDEAPSQAGWGERFSFRLFTRLMSRPRQYELALKSSRLALAPFRRRGRIPHLPGPLHGWTAHRDLPVPPKQSFRDWWRAENGSAEAGEPDEKAVAWSPPAAPPPAAASESWLARTLPEDLVGEFVTRLTAAGGQAHLVSDDVQVRLKLRDILGKRLIQQAAVTDHPILHEMALEQLLLRLGIELVWPEAGEGPTWLTAVADAELGLTGAEYAVAASGSLVMVATPHHPRAFSLLPPLHIALVKTSQILPDLAALARQLRTDFPDTLPSGVVLISGPSRTADIEQTLTIGVHGPGELHVLITP